MLPNLGYFSAINCPGLCQDGGCKRPYCHFRHSHAASGSKNTSTANFSQKGNKLQSQIDEVTAKKRNDESAIDSDVLQSISSNDVSDAASDDCLPYTPYQGAAVLYKPFKDPANIQTADHSKLERWKSTSVLHGARGASSSLRSRKQLKKKKMNYAFATTSKPASDLEYDPMCNFNLKVKRKQNLTTSFAGEASDGINNEMNQEAVEDLPANDLVIDDSVIECRDASVEKHFTSNECQSSKKSGCDSLVVSDVETIVVTDDDDNSSQGIEQAPIVISDSESEDDTKSNSLSSLRETPIDSNKNITISSNDQTSKNNVVHRKKSIKMSTLLFGSDSDNDNTSKPSARKTVSGKSHDVKLKRKRSCPTSDAKESFAHLSRNKISEVKHANSKHSTTSGKVIKDKRKPSARRKDDVEKVAIKQKKPKLDDQVKSFADVSKYVDEKEIQRLNRDLNDEGIFDECYRIYQESLDETKSQNKPKPKEPDQKVVAKEKFKKAEEPAPIASSRSRIAHSASSSSANLLNRTVKQARRTLTPAQKMMQRMESIQLEQEEKILSAALKRVSSQQKPSDGGRMAHRPSASLNSTSLSLSRKHVLASKALSSSQSTLATNKRPFQDLRSSPSTTSTTQGTVVKGYERVAHASKSSGKDSNLPERPRILPDRHSKVPTNVRQRYLTVFIDECLRIFDNNHKKAYQMAEMEETQCSSRSKTKTIYLSLAASTVKKLREMKPAGKPQLNGKSKLKDKSDSQNIQASTSTSTKVVFKSNTRRISHGISASEAMKLKELNKEKAPVQKSMSHKSILDKSTRLCKGGYSFTSKVEEKVLSGEELYESMCRYIMTEDELASNGFPRPDILPGKCKFMTEQPKLNKDRSRKICARCGKEFVLYKGGQFARKDDECLHHWGRAYSTKVGSNWEQRYSCCQTPIGAEGCSVGETHVHKDNTHDCSCYVKTLWKAADTGNPGIYALDCEMAFTVDGLELIRVSVVDFDCELVYDSLVKPNGKILDYNTRWSGLSEDDLKGITTSIRDVQAVLLSKFSSDTILMGHSLESDLKALRIIHSTVVDTSIVFPHRLGPPYKRALRHLMAEHLGIIIQNCADEGHDSTEDASACVKLMKWKSAEDAKVSR